MVYQELHIIYNPISNNKKSVSVFKEVTNYLISHKIKYIAHTTGSPNHAIKITERLSATPILKRIIVISGDGVLAEVVNGITNFDSIEIALVPAGSGNDFANNFKHITSNTVIQNTLLALNGTAKNIDFLELNNDLRIINSFGFGIDSSVIDKYNSMKRFSQKAKYKIASIQKALFFSKFKCEFSLDDSSEKIQSHSIIFVVGNGQTFGGGINCCPGAKIDDGIITVTRVEQFSRWKTIYNIVKLLKKDALALKTTKQHSCKKIKLKLDRKIYQCDGEVYKNTDQITIEVISNKLKFVH